MAIPLTPYSLGRQWMAGQGPHAGKDYFEVMETLGFDFTSENERQFAAGADAFADEIDKYGEAEA